MPRPEDRKHGAARRAVAGQRVAAEPEGNTAPHGAPAARCRQRDRAALLGHALLADTIQRDVGVRRTEAEPAADRLLGDGGER